MEKIYYDLHIHTCLSPCGSDDMTPPNIANMAYINGLGVIAITDHNSCRNVGAVITAAKDLPLIVIAGIELCTVEEVHIVCLFPTLDQCVMAGEEVERHLIPVANDPKIFGEQWIMDETEQITGTVSSLLINATTLSIDNVVAFVEKYDGICYPAHVEKPSYSVLANLGFLTPEMGFTTIEVKNLTELEKHPFAKKMIADYRIVTSSDAHYLQDIGADKRFIMVTEKSVTGILDYFRS